MNYWKMIPRYGKYGGPGHKGQRINDDGTLWRDPFTKETHDYYYPPDDDLDKCFRRHDEAYDAAEELAKQGKLQEAQWERMMADARLVDEIITLDPNSPDFPFLQPNWDAAYAAGYAVACTIVFNPFLLPEHVSNTTFTYIDCYDHIKRYYANAATAQNPQQDPLFLDLDGDGIETIGPETYAFFDHDGNAFAEKTGWVAPDDGILVLDRNGDGVINSGRELFGDQTILKNGDMASGGFQALADIDDNGDGRIDAGDGAWTQLRVWRDLDSNGISGSDEFYTLEELGIRTLNTGCTDTTVTDGKGNTKVQTGSYERTDGTISEIGTFLLQRDILFTLAVDWLPEPAELEMLPDLRGTGTVYDLHQAMARELLSADQIDDLPLGFDIQTVSLKTLVENFADEKTIDGRNRLMDQILFRWTGAEMIDPSSRGPCIDARKLYVLEKFLVTDFLGAIGPNPNQLASGYLNQAYTALYEMYYAQLMFQTHLKDSFDQIMFQWDPATHTLNGDLTQVATEITERFSENLQSGKEFLGEFSRALRGSGSIEVVDFLPFRDYFAAQGEDLAWIVDSAGVRKKYGSPENETLSGDSGDDAIAGGDGNDRLYSNGGSDVLYGQSGNDYIQGNNNDEILNGGSGDDTLFGSYGADLLEGGSGNDTLYGGYDLAQDILRGNEGNDSLFGEKGDDILDGGAGDDLLYGGWGDDTYLYGKGSGSDTIYSYEIERVGWYGDTINRNGIDTVQFGEGLAPDSFKYIGEGSNKGGNLVLRNRETGETLKFDKWLNGDYYQVDRFKFADGTELTASEISQRINIIISGTGGNDNLNYGFDGYKNEIFGLAGNDYLYGRNQDDYLNGGDGDDWIYGSHGNDVVEGDAGNDVLFGYMGNDVLRGGTGNDTLYAEYDNDILEGGTGNDGLYGSTGSDTYLFAKGYGQDKIEDYDTAAGNIDTVRLGEGIDKQGLVMFRDGLDLLIFTDDDDYIRVSRQFQANYGIERLEVTDGCYITRQDMEHIVNAMIDFNSTQGMDIVQQYDTLRNDQAFQTTLAQTWHQQLNPQG
ncbi:MAG: hypothetical protein NTV99_08035 [Deltaproteobacteria bacterium]|nr:hypothetical protein [Deltaproteobacteria bacterium]